MKVRHIFLLVTILLLVGACRKQVQETYSWPPTAPSEASVRVLFLAVDAADWDDIDPLIDRGELPHIAALKHEAAWGNQQSVSDNSPAIWTSIATGVAPNEHGIEQFTAENPDYDPNDPNSMPFTGVSSTMRKRKALWNLLSDAGKSVGIVGWFATWPAEPVNGYIISSYASLDVNQGGDQLTGKGTFFADRPDLIYPPQLGVTEGRNLSVLTEKGEKEGLATGERVFEGYPDLQARKGRAVEETMWVFIADDIFFQIGKRLLQEYPTDFFAVYLAGIDVIGHRFHGTPEDAEVLRRYYHRVDEMIGELVSVVAEDTIIIMASDHGTAYPGPTHDYDGGVFLYKGNCIRSGQYTVQSDSLDFLPTLLALMGVPVPVGLPKKPMDFLFQDQWRRENPVRFANVNLERETFAAPNADSYRDEVFKRLTDLGYVGSDGQSKKLQ